MKWSKNKTLPSGAPLLASDEQLVAQAAPATLKTGPASAQGTVFLTTKRLIHADQRRLALEIALDSVASCAVVARAPAVVLALQIERQWICSICYFSNAAAATRCAACGVPMQPDAVLADPADSPVAHSLDPGECPQCTFMNHRSLAFCELCGAPLRADTLASGSRFELTVPAGAAAFVAALSSACRPPVRPGQPPRAPGAALFGVQKLHAHTRRSNDDALALLDRALTGEAGFLAVREQLVALSERLGAVLGVGTGSLDAEGPYAGEASGAGAGPGAASGSEASSGLEGASGLEASSGVESSRGVESSFLEGSSGFASSRFGSSPVESSSGLEEGFPTSESSSLASRSVSLAPETASAASETISGSVPVAPGSVPLVPSARVSRSTSLAPEASESASLSSTSPSLYPQSAFSSLESTSSADSVSQTDQSTSSPFQRESPALQRESSALRSASPAQPSASPAPQRESSTSQSAASAQSSVYRAPQSESSSSQSAASAQSSGSRAPQSESSTSQSAASAQSSVSRAPQSESSTSQSAASAQSSGSRAPRSESSTSQTAASAQSSGSRAPRSESSTSQTAASAQPSASRAPRSESSTSQTAASAQPSASRAPQSESSIPQGAASAQSSGSPAPRRGSPALQPSPAHRSTPSAAFAPVSASPLPGTALSPALLSVPSVIGATTPEAMAHELAGLLIGSNVLARAGGMLTLHELYALYNRARGVSLISAQELLDALALCEPLDLPLRCRRLGSGLQVVESRGGLDQALKRLLHWIAAESSGWRASAGFSARDVGEYFGYSVQIAREELLLAEARGQLCRDENITGLRFFPNLIAQRQAEMSREGKV